MKIYVDIDGTICETPHKGDYTQSVPYMENIAKINKLYDEGHIIIYWTARGMSSGINWEILTINQLRDWGCKHHKLIMNEKPNYDLLICDKTKRIEEI